MPIAFVALGSNLGDRPANLDRAIALLRAEPHVRLVDVSQYHITPPIDAPAGSPDFLNAVCSLETDLPPERILDILFRIEHQLGRVRTGPNAPRVIDLDLLMVGSERRATPELTLPHPRLHERAFVLVPFAEIAPEVVHPVRGKSIRELRDEVGTVPGMVPYAEQSMNGEGELTGLRAVVTGSSGGIGLAMACEFARAGASVLLHGSRAGEKLQRAVAEVGRVDIEPSAVAFDLTDPSACGALITAAWDWSGEGVDIWVNNAGADTLTGKAAEWDFDQKWAALVAIDMTATIRLSRSIGERMRARGRGVILNVGWDQAEEGMEGDSGQLFAASKAAIMAFSRSLAKSLAPEVRVNCLAPGWIRTAWGETASAAWQQRVHDETPLQRWGLPEDVASAARWLASPSASFITGETIRVSGGAVRR